MQTIRQQIISLLALEPMGVRALSQELKISEKMVYDHLPHAARTAQKLGKKLTMDPCRCLSCNFVFKERRRFTRPGRCPQCKGTHLQGPLYFIR